MKRDGSWPSWIMENFDNPMYDLDVTEFDIWESNTTNATVGTMKSYCFRFADCTIEQDNYNYRRNLQSSQSAEVGGKKVGSRNLQSSQSAEVGGIGETILKFGGRRLDLVDDNDGRRILQQEAEPVSAQIGVSIGLETLDDGPAALRTAGGVTTTTTSMVVTSIIGLLFASGASIL